MVHIADGRLEEQAHGEKQSHQIEHEGINA
jgi:hypothetical protein